MELGKVIIISSSRCSRCRSQWSPAFGAGKSSFLLGGLPLGVSSRNGAQLLELGKAASGVGAGYVRHVAMEPSFWSWEKSSSDAAPGFRLPRRNGAQLLELGKGRGLCPSSVSRPGSQWSPAFGAGKSLLVRGLRHRQRGVAMEPSFWSWEKPEAAEEFRANLPVAMEPSFWSWEKIRSRTS